MNERSSAPGKIADNLVAADEFARLAAVKRYDILDTPPDGAFDRVTAIAASLFDVPISIVSIVDHDRIWFKSHHGLDVAEIGRDPGLCASAILRDDPLIVPDAKRDVHALANPLVAGAFGLRFYAGAPLRTPDGYNLGTLCVIDRQPRQVSAQEIAVLQDLASIVMDQLELRWSARTALLAQDALVEGLARREKRFRALVDASAQVVWTTNADGEVEEDSPSWRAFTGQTYGEWKGFGWLDAIHPDDRQRIDALWRRAVAEKISVDAEYRLRHVSGGWRWTTVRASPLLDDGAVSGWVGMNVDMSEQHRRQMVAQGQKEAFEQAASGAAIDAVLGILARTAREQSVDGAWAAIFSLDEDGAHLHPSAAAGIPDGYTQAMDGFPVGPQHPSCGTTAHTGQAVIVRDVEQDALWAPYRALAREHGFRACWSFPISSYGGKVLGTFALYHPIPCEPDPRDLELVTLLADTAAVLMGRHNEAESRRRMETALRHRTAEFETLVNEAPLGVYLVDADFRIRDVNPTALSVFGNVPDLIGRDFAEVIHILWPQAYAEEIVRRFRHTLETGEPCVVAERRDQRRVRDAAAYYDWRISRLPLPEGGVGVVCYFRDVSAQVLARHAIAEAAQNFRFLAESTAQKVFTADAAGAVDYFNPAWTEFTGLSFEQIKNWGWTQFVHPDDVEKTVRLWTQCVDSGEPFQFEHRFRRADGDYRWHLSRATAMRYGTGKIHKWIGSSTDIHPQRMREQAASQAASHAEIMAHEIDHRVMNSLQFVSGLLAMQGRLADDGRVAGELSIVAGRVAAIARVHRHFAQQEAAETMPCLAFLGRLSADLSDILQVRIDIEGTEMAMPTRRILPIGLLLNEFVTNAAKHGAGTIQVSFQSCGDGSCTLCVSDEGKGLSADFDPENSGNGLGMKVILGLTAQLAGKLVAEANPTGRGARFAVTFPAAL